MKKSIYDEALESVKQHHEVTDMSLEIKVLEQAQKQEKLLELYKQLNICYKKLIEHESLIYSLNTWQSSQIMDLEHQIKELENNEN